MSHTSIIVLTYFSSIMTLFSLSSKQGEGEGAVYTHGLYKAWKCEESYANVATVLYF